MNDNYDLFVRHDAEQEAWLAKLPRCGCCGEPIQDDYLYEINGEALCEHCLNEYYRKDVENYV